MGSGITVCIPTIPPRGELLLEAVGSVTRQTLPADGIAIATDVDHEGVWVTRQRAAVMADTEWVAQLDDDDLLLPEHLEALAGCQAETGADYVFSWFWTDPPGPGKPPHDVVGHFGKPFDPERPHLTTSTVLIRRSLLTSIELGPPPPEWEVAQDDWRLVQGACALGAKVVHLPRRTWIYRHHSAHTSGQPHKW